MGTNGPLVQAVRLALADAADPERAVGQQRYMRSEMPFRGVRSPDLKALLRPLLADPAHRLPDAAAWAATVRALWDEAGYREERYAAIAVARHRACASWATDPVALPLYRHLVVTGAWWDYVDDVAAHLLGPLLRAHPDQAGLVRSWAQEPDMWIRRAAILAQLGARERTDTALLADVVAENLLGSRFGDEFFIRKAVGWALRDYARTDMPWVVARTDALGHRLAPLSRREALKHLPA